MNQTNLDLKLVVPVHFSAFENSVKKGEIDFTLQDPHTYLMLANHYNQEEILNSLSTEGETTQSAVVVVRQDSHIKNLNDLRGKTVMFGPKSSITKWLAARMLFIENGINIEKDLKAYTNGGCCEDIAFSVYLKSFDAGAVCEHFLAEHEEKQKELGVEASKILIIGKTKSMPTKVFVPHKNVNKDIVAKINHALLALDRKNPEHAKILFRCELGGFQRAKDTQYEAVRSLMKGNSIE